EFYCDDNQIIRLNNLGDCYNLKAIERHGNLLAGLDLSQNKKLELIGIGDNNFSQQNLSFLSNLEDLKVLDLGNSNKERIDQGIYNRFVGSLEYIKNCTKLERITIANTDIGEGL